MINVTQFKGMNLEDALSLAKNLGLQTSIESAGLQRLNCEFRQGRVNFRVTNGIVQEAYIG